MTLTSARSQGRLWNIRDTTQLCHPEVREPGFCPSTNLLLIMSCPWEKGMSSLDNLPGIFKVGGSHLVKGSLHRSTQLRAIRIQHSWQVGVRYPHGIGDLGRPPTVYHGGLKLAPLHFPLPTDFHVRGFVFECCVYVHRKELKLET